VLPVSRQTEPAAVPAPKPSKSWAALANEVLPVALRAPRWMRCRPGDEALWPGVPERGGKQRPGFGDVTGPLDEQRPPCGRYPGVVKPVGQFPTANQRGDQRGLPGC